MMLKACPFCGGTAYLERSSRAYVQGKEERVAYVRCTSCNARTNKVPLSKFGHTSRSKSAEEIAVYDWNLRIDE